MGFDIVSGCFFDLPNLEHMTPTWSTEKVKLQTAEVSFDLYRSVVSKLDHEIKDLALKDY